MKKYLFAVLLLLVGSPGAASAQMLIGAGVGSMAVSFDDDEVEKAPTNASFTLGYQFKSFAPGLAVELSISRSVEPGTVAGGELDVESMGMYLVYRAGNQFYVKGRAGLMNAAISGNLAEDENGETYGVGLGWRMHDLSLELEYTSIDDDISFVSAGLLFQLF